jgi:hypothetical protein
MKILCQAIWAIYRITYNSEKKIFRLLRLQHRRLHLRQLCLATLGGSPSRTPANYRQHSGARHQLAPEFENSRSRSTISSTSATRRSQQRSGARQQLCLRSWLRFYDNNLASVRGCDSTTSTRRPLRPRLRSAASTTSASTSTTSSSTTPRRPRRTQ